MELQNNCGDVSTEIASTERRIRMEKKEEARSREAALIQAILAQVRRSYGEPVEDDDDDTMSSDDQ